MAEIRRFENREIVNEKSSDFDKIWFTVADLELGESRVSKYKNFFLVSPANCMRCHPCDGVTSLRSNFVNGHLVDSTGWAKLIKRGHLSCLLVTFEPIYQIK